MSLFRAKFPKNSIIFLYLSKKFEMLLMSTFDLSEKIKNGVSYQVREIFSPFCNLFALTLA